MNIGTKAFLLCAGSQDRWTGKGFKQLVHVHGEALLDRTIRQLKCLGLSTYTASKTERLNRSGSTWIRIKRTTCTLDTLRQTMHLWDCYPVFVLCGDVYWTDEGIDLLTINKHPQITFYTDSHEIFGIRIDDLAFANHWITKIDPESIKDDPYGRAGRLGRLYRELVGKSDQEFDYGAKIGPVNGTYAKYVLDGTTDFDSYQGYLEFIQCLEHGK